MDDRSLKVLDFFHLLDLLKKHTVSPLGQKRCEALRPTRDLLHIRSRLSEILEMKEILETEGDIPLRGLQDTSALLSRLEVEGTVLTIQELVDLAGQLGLCQALKRFFQKVDKTRFPLLQTKVGRLSSLKHLEREILRSVSSKEGVLDGASPALSDIRQRLGTLRERAKAVLERLLRREDLKNIFQEDFITLRNGRYVVLIKSEHKHHLEGIVHDQSQSGMTFFFEPIQILHLNNEINILIAEERDEEYRILAELSGRLREEIPTLLKDQEVMGDLDLLYGMARFSILLKSIPSDLNEEGCIDMRQARNPLLVLQEKAPVVPIHLRMEPPKRVLVFSGANAGGKTVALKTLGLLTLMAQSGLPIPVAEGSRTAVFQEVYAVIGDEQDLEENLSTFSGHLLHVNRVMERSGPRSLVLLDELGVGTHASEGCALAMGFLDRLRELGASAVVTTHFDRLKIYGYLHPDVENVAVQFDERTLEPKYTLSYGASGWSNAFPVAEKLGISTRVLEKARHYLDAGEQEVRHALETLERLRGDAEREKGEWTNLKDEAAREHQRWKGLVQEIRKKRQEIFLQAEGKASRLVHGLEEELKGWIRERREEKGTLTPPRLNRHRKHLEEIKERFFPPSVDMPFRGVESEASLTGLKVGERVRIVSLQSQGVLTSVQEPPGQVEVQTEKAKVRTALSDLRRLSGPGQSKETATLEGALPRGGEAREIPSQLNVIGLTIEEALPQVDRFIDQALLHGLEKVQIIHGVGSGRLRSAIGRYLQEHRAVKKFGTGDALKRGGGVTIVELE
jgi:DNA mismatch repair protein MutS2